MLLGAIIVPSCSKGKLWNALADAVNDVSMDTTKKFTSSAEKKVSGHKSTLMTPV